ncbi:MAG: tetratricopeptide repeat protein [Gammaproteobacteria bacterium]|nr:tetratricopeptide repeat protein [Gammaproteobacteria bacterium]
MTLRNRSLLPATVSVLLSIFCISACDKYQHPDTGQLAAGVRETIKAAQDRFDQERSTVDTPAEEANNWGNLCRVYHAHHLMQAAGNCYQHAIRVNPEDIRWRYYRAHVQRDTGDLESAAEGFRAVLEQQPGNAPAQYHLALSLIELGQPEEAGKLLRLLDERETNPAVLGAIGKAALLQDNYSDAINALEQALSIQPQATRLHYPAAMAWRALGEPQRAAGHLQLAGDNEAHFPDPLMRELAELSRSAQIYQERGRAALGQGDLSTAEREFRSAVQWDPKDASARAALALVLQRTGRQEEAVEQLESAIVASPHNAAYHYLIGMLYERMRKVDEAIAAYRQAVGLDPRYPEPRVLLGHAEMRRSNYSAALDHYVIAADNLQQSIVARYHAGLAALAAGDCGRAAEFFEAALARQQNYGPVIMALVRVRSVCPGFSDHRDETLAMAHELYDAAPSNDEVSATLAMALAADGQYTDAAKFQPDKNAYRQNLLRYRNQQGAEEAWARDAAVYNPPLLQNGL